MTDVASASDMHLKEIGDKKYRFRTPNLYDLPKMRMRLRKEGVRRPQMAEYEAAALAGVAAMADATGEAQEGERQSAMIERWYQMAVPTDENDLDEPDFELRAAELERLEAARRGEVAKLYPEILMIEANLDRHFAPWRDMRADAEYYDEISRIDSVRLLLREIDGRKLPIDKDDLIIEQVYGMIEETHRMMLGTFALQLLVPSEAEKKS